jgi:glyoxylase-like metal-dependent hydrolase (beta-lactamase superfamily II)
MTTDTFIMQAGEQVRAVLRGEIRPPHIKAFFDEQTFTATYVVHDPATKSAAIIDSVLNFNQASGRTSFESADQLIAYVRAENLTVEWLLETHAHADHLSAAPYLQKHLGGKLAIGADILTVQKVFGRIFNEGTQFARDGSQFDRLLNDGETLMFSGDTMFMPDYGSARCDFPGGDAHNLYRSVRRLMELPDATRVLLCHDYKAPGRDDYAWETTILAERTANVHMHEGVSEDQFVAMRTERDATLSMPKLILPALQVNMRAGHLPPAEDNGVRYLKLPLDLL